MKRIGALVCLIIMMVSVMAPAAFAVEANSQNTGFTLVESIPHDKDEGVSVENLSVKIYFSQDVVPANEKIENKNAKQFKLTDAEGKNIPIKVYYSDKEEGLLMVASNVHSKDARKTNSVIKGDMDYTLTIGKNFQAADGTKLGAEEVVTFKTLDQQKSTTVYMILMAVMMVGMIVFTTKSAKKAAEKEAKESGKSATVNPYKEAKRTGKSVEEIVAKDAARKAKEAERKAKEAAAEAERKVKAAIREITEEAIDFKESYSYCMSECNVFLNSYGEWMSIANNGEKILDKYKTILKTHNLKSIDEFEKEYKVVIAKIVSNAKAYASDRQTQTNIIANKGKVFEKIAQVLKILWLSIVGAIGVYTIVEGVIEYLQSGMFFIFAIVLGIVFSVIAAAFRIIALCGFGTLWWPNGFETLE